MWPFNKKSEVVVAKRKPNKMSLLPETMVKVRDYAAAMINRLTEDWNAWSTTGNYEIYSAMVKTRDRARELDRNNAWVYNGLNYLETQVIGKGIKLSSEPMNNDGKVDKDAKKIIQKAWLDWGKPENCEVTGKYSWNDIERLSLRSRKRDGEFLLRVVIDARYKYGFKLQLLETDTLDFELNIPSLKRNGHKIVMGVEMDSLDKPVAYWLRSTAKNAISLIPEQPGRKHQRHAADKILHGFKTTRLGQVRGICEFASVITDFHMLDGYFEAEVISARIAACIMYQVVPTPGVDFEGTEDRDGLPPQFTAQPGELWNGQDGKIEPIEVKHPVTGQDAFINQQLYKISTGMGIGFDSMTNNYSNSNYSSSRLGKLTERDGFKIDQQLQVSMLSHPVFDIFLNRAFTARQMNNLSPLNYDKFKQVVFVPRSWPFVDPVKDIQAMQMLRKSGWISDEYGITQGPQEDIDSVYAQLNNNAQLAKSLGLSLGEDQIKDTFTDQDEEEAAEAANNQTVEIIEEVEEPEEDERGFKEGLIYPINGLEFIWKDEKLQEVK